MAESCIWLVRHAQPMVAPGVCYGALDVPADANATLQTAQTLARALPQRARVFASPLQRCELLAQTLQGLRPDLTYQLDARLVEMDFGVFEGQRWDSISVQAYDAWTGSFWQHRFGGAESVAELMGRVRLAWRDALTDASDQTPVWITHAGVIRAATLLAQGVWEVHQADRWPAQAPGFGQSCQLPLGPAAG